MRGSGIRWTWANQVQVATVRVESPMDFLSDFERQFCKAYVVNGVGVRAYLAVRPNTKNATARNYASTLLAKRHIKAEVKRLQDEQFIASLLGMEERRQFLADLTRAEPQTVLASKPHLAQAVDIVRRTKPNGDVEEVIRVKLGDKLRAIELDARLSGELREREGEEEDRTGLRDALDVLMGLRDPDDLPKGITERQNGNREPLAMVGALMGLEDEAEDLL
jgi:hypothetical protein